MPRPLIRFYFQRFVLLGTACIIAAVQGLVVLAQGADLPATANSPAATSSTNTSAAPFPRGSLTVTVDKTGARPKPPAAGGVAVYKYKGDNIPANEYTLVGQDVQESEALYTISVKNFSAVSAANLEIEYHFYNVTNETDDGVVAPPVLTDITAVKHVQVAAKKSIDIAAAPIPVVDNTTSLKPSLSWFISHTPGATPYSPIPLLQYSTITKLVGWRVQVRYNRAVVYQTFAPIDLQDKLDQINQQAAQAAQKQQAKRKQREEMKAAFASFTPVALPPNGTTNTTATEPGPALPQGTISIMVSQNDQKAMPASTVYADGTVLVDAQGDMQNVVQKVKNYLANTYAISVNNSSRDPVKGLEVAYHFYFSKQRYGNAWSIINSRESLIRSIPNDPVIIEIASGKQVDLDARKSIVINSPPIPLSLELTSTDKYTDAYYQRHPEITGADKSEEVETYNMVKYIGWHVEVRYHGAVVAQTDDPIDLQEKLGEIYKPNEAK